MLPEFPPPATPASPTPPGWRFWPDFWKGFGLCLLLCLVLGFACVMAIGVGFKMAEAVGTVVMLCSMVAGLIPLTLIVVLAFRRRPSGHRAGWIVGAVICYAVLILLPVVICFGVLIAVSAKH